MVMLQQMIVLFLMMAIGFLCFKKGILTEEVSKKVSAIVVNVANPCMILESALTDQQMKGKELLQTLLLVALMYGFLLVLAWILPRILRIKKESSGTYSVMTVFANIGFMGFPVLAAMYGSGALLYAAVFQIPFNILIYTYGVAMLTKHRPAGGTEKDKRNKENRWDTMKKILNIGVLACMMAILIYFLQIPVPQFLQSLIENLGNLTAPLSMMVIGASLAQMPIRDLFLDRKLFVFSMIKLLALPAVWMLLVNRLVDQEILRGVCLVMMATPAASMTAMLAQQYDADYETASRGVALTTLLSVITMPILAAVFL